MRKNITLYLYISSCHKAHKALTSSFHPLPFAAKALTVIHDCHPATRLSSSTILLHVVYGRPGLLHPSGLHSNAVTLCSSLFFLIICPIQFHLRRLISSLVLFTPVCDVVRGHLILSMRFMHLYWKASSFFASVFVSLKKKNITEMTENVDEQGGAWGRDLVFVASSLCVRAQIIQTNKLRRLDALRYVFLLGV